MTSSGVASIHPSLCTQANLSGAGNLIEWEDRSQVNDPVVLQGRGQRITDCLMTKLYEKEMTRNKITYYLIPGSRVGPSSYNENLLTIPSSSLQIVHSKLG